MSVVGIGLEPRIEEKIDLISRSKETRLVMRLARKAGISYSEARDRWRLPDDLAMEFAFDAIEAAETLTRCPDCNVDPADVLDPDTNKPLDKGLWKIYETFCWFCGELARARKNIDEDDQLQGRQIRPMPRGPGEPFRDFLAR